MNGMIRIVAAGSVIMLGCAHSGPGSTSDGQSAYSINDVDTQPEFVACARYEPPRNGLAYNMRRVAASFTVTAAGTVEDVMVRSSRRPALAAEGTDDVRAIVSSCSYSPATIDGMAVAVRNVSRSFLLPVEPEVRDARDLMSAPSDIVAKPEPPREEHPIPPPRHN